LKVRTISAILLVTSIFGSAQAQNTNSLAPAFDSANTSSTIQTSARVTTPEGSSSQVHDRLKLTDAQLPLWLAFMARIDDYSKVYYRERPTSATSGDSAPRQIGRLFDNMQNRLAALDEIERTAKALYAVLDPDQRQTADQLLFSTIPVFASSSNLACPPPNEGKQKGERAEGAQHKRHAGGMGGMGQ
jgi:hypothetical protein